MGYLMFSGRFIVTEFEWMGREMVMTYFKALSQNLA
jgi:hypothetical protein